MDRQKQENMKTNRQMEIRKRENKWIDKNKNL